MAESILEKDRLSIYKLSICRKLVRLSICRLSIIRPPPGLLLPDSYVESHCPDSGEEPAWIWTENKIHYVTIRINLIDILAIK